MPRSAPAGRGAGGLTAAAGPALCAGFRGGVVAGGAGLAWGRRRPRVWRVREPPPDASPPSAAPGHRHHRQRAALQR